MPQNLRNAGPFNCIVENVNMLYTEIYKMYTVSPFFIGSLLIFPQISSLYKLLFVEFVNRFGVNDEIS